MKVTHYQQMMAYLTRPGYNKGGKVLPKKKPQEEIKKRSRINYEKLKKYLDPESQMFIERELGFKKGGKVITQSQFEKLWNKFEGRNKEFADILNNKNFVTATGKKFTDKNVSEYVGYYELDRKPRGGKIFPTTQKKLDKLDKLIVESNNSYKRTPNIGELIRKSGFVKSGKISDISRDGPAQSLVREKLKKLLTTNQKMENYINNVMLSEDALVKDFYAPSEHLRKKFNISSGTYAKFMKNSKAIANNKELFLNLGRVQSFNKYGFNPDGSSKTVSEFSQIITNRVPFSAGFGALREDNATSQILKSAIRNHYKSIAAGKTPQITFVTNPDITPVQDLQFIDNKTGRLFSVDPSIENVEFRGKTYKNNYLNNVNASKLYAKEFGNIYKIYDNDLPKYMAATIPDGKGGQIKLDTALRQKFYNRTGSKNFLTRRAVEVDHLNLIDDPFGRKKGNLRLIDRITNVQAGGVKQARDVARGKNPKLLKERLDNIGYNVKDKNVDDLITRLSDDYKKPIKFVSPRTEQNILKRKGLIKDLPSAVEKLPKDTQIRICRKLGAKKLGGISQDCAVALKQNPTQTAGIVFDETKNLKTKTGVRATGLARELIRLGIGSEIAFLGGEAVLGNIFSGRPFTESLQSTFFMPGKADAARERRAGLTTREQMISDAIGLQGKIASLESQIEVARAEGNDASVPGLEKALRETKAELESPVDPTDRLGDTTLEDLTSPYSATNISRQRKLDNIRDADTAKSPASQMTLRDVEQGIPNIADYGEIDPGVSRKVFEPRKTLPADDDFFEKYMREQLLPSAGLFLSEKEFSVDPMDPTDKLKSETIYDVFRKEMTPMDEFSMKGSDPRFAEQIYGTQGKFAGGGIAKMAGVDSGPPPKSGPTPQGLDFLMKRGR